MRRQDWLVHQLPVGMLDDPFLVRFLAIFQDVADTVFEQVDNLPHMFEPAVAPPSMLREMGSWLGIHIDSSLPVRLQRRMVSVYGALLPWRGTKRGLTDLLSALTHGPVVITDTGGVYPEGEAPDHTPHVRVEVDSAGEFTEVDLLQFLKGELPASVTFELYVAGRRIWPPTPAPEERAMSEVR